jgi:hypothetical protein
VESSLAVTTFCPSGDQSQLLIIIVWALIVIMHGFILIIIPLSIKKVYSIKPVEATRKNQWNERGSEYATLFNHFNHGRDSNPLVHLFVAAMETGEVSGKFEAIANV